MSGSPNENLERTWHWFANSKRRGKESGQPAEVLARALGRDGDYGQVEMPPDQLGDVADRHALVDD